MKPAESQLRALGLAILTGQILTTRTLYGEDDGKAGPSTGPISGRRRHHEHHEGTEDVA